MRRLPLIVSAAAVVLCGCGGGARSSSGGYTPLGVTVGQQVYALDQLAPAPDDGSGARLLYAVVRVATSGARHTEHASFFTLVDAAGHVYTPVAPTVYEPVDHLDGLTVAPGQPGAGVVAFPVPLAAPVELLVADGSDQGTLHVP